MNLPDAAAPLFELPPEEFTAERDRISKVLKKSGDDVAAAAVKGLKRPSTAAYALNLVARQHPDLVTRLLDAGERLGTATSRAAMDDAKTDRQRAIAAITARAVSLLADQERSITAQVKEKLTETLLAAATDDETRQRLKSGVLLKEAIPGGFGGPVTGFEPPPAGGDEQRISERAGRLRAEAEAKLAEARKAVADSERATRESRELAEASAAAKERAERLGNIARKAQELASARLAEAEEMEKSRR